MYSAPSSTFMLEFRAFSIVHCYHYYECWHCVTCVCNCTRPCFSMCTCVYVSVGGGGGGGVGGGACHYVCVRDYHSLLNLFHAEKA